MECARITDFSERRPDAARYGPPLDQSAALRRLSASQWTGLVVLLSAAIFLLLRRPEGAGDVIVAASALAFLAVSCWRVALILLSMSSPSPMPSPEVWPRYTVLAALYGEAEVVGQLVERLSRIDYPMDRLQGLLVLEAHDHETIDAALATTRPDWLDILVTPPGVPQTKPRALNHALAQATGDLLTVYDAEDDPDPLQLKEAAARFSSDTSGRLACLQAPLRIRPGRKGPAASPFLDRQFAAEYAGLFETALPGMARLGLPFPLGGTSNHFRVDALRAVGGWDSWNVTEDADLGFRFWRHSWRLGVISRPTWEAPPGGLADWLPQRTRWLKGYMQTWGVHTRRPWQLGWRGGLSIILTLGAGLVSAAVHGATIAWVTASVLVAITAGLPPATPRLALSVLILGAAAAWLSCAVGARRAGVAYGPQDMIAAPAYWALLSLAFLHAGWRLVREPFAWDKTRHYRDSPDRAGASIDDAETPLDEAPPIRLSAGHASAP